MEWQWKVIVFNIVIIYIFFKFHFIDCWPPFPMTLTSWYGTPSDIAGSPICRRFTLAISLRLSSCRIRAIHVWPPERPTLRFTSAMWNVAESHPSGAVRAISCGSRVWPHVRIIRICCGRQRRTDWFCKCFFYVFLLLFFFLFFFYYKLKFLILK